jgi:hypothetical protein
VRVWFITRARGMNTWHYQAGVAVEYDAARGLAIVITYGLVIRIGTNSLYRGPGARLEGTDFAHLPASSEVNWALNYWPS